MSVPVTVTIKEDQRAWLFKHPEINVSGLMQKGIIDLMNREKKEGYQSSNVSTSAKKRSSNVK